jgi:hypothetical protein
MDDLKDDTVVVFDKVVGELSSIGEESVEKPADQFDEDTASGTILVMKPPSDVENTSIIHPYSPFKIGWDLTGMILLLYNVVVVPYRIAWDDSPELGTPMFIFEAIVDWFFVVDIFIQFRTAVFVNHMLICSPKLIALNYLQGWFWVDVSSSMPIDFFLAVLEVDTKLSSLKMIRMLRLAKLAKLLRLMKMGSATEVGYSSVEIAISIDLSFLFRRI